MTIDAMLTQLALISMNNCLCDRTIEAARLARIYLAAVVAQHNLNINDDGIALIKAIHKDKTSGE